MKTMDIKKLAAALMASSMVIVAGCGGNEQAQNTNVSSENVNTTVAQASSANNLAGDNKTLIVYFSYSENADLPDGVDASSRASIRLTDEGVIGNTGAVARMIQKDTQGEVISLKTVEKYSADYDETVNKGKEELAAKARPALATHIDNIDDYDTIFVGYPNWWADMPMAMYTFFEEYDLSGKTIVPFSTSGGSGLSNTVDEIKELEPNAQVKDGLTIGNNDIDSAQSKVDSWLKDLGYLE